MTKSSRWLRIAGLLLLGFLLWKIDFRRILQVLSKADPVLVALAALLNIPQISLKAYRWNRLLKSQEISYPISSTILSYFGSIFIGLLTPGRVGEFIKTWHISHDCGVPKMRAFSSVLADRLFDLYALLLFGGAALLSKTVHHNNAAIFGFVATSLLLILPLWLFLSEGSFLKIQQIGMRAGKFGAKLFAQDSWIPTLRQGLKELKWGSILQAIVLTALAYAVFFGQCWLLARAIRLNADFLQVSFAVSLGSLVTLLPISISGLGTREAAIVGYLGTLGVPSDASLGFSLLVFCTFYIAGALFGAIAWWIKPVSWKTVHELEAENPA
jgi:glycosyltransferase 2 family protein